MSIAESLTRHLDTVTRQRGVLGAPHVLVRSPDLDYRYGPADRPFQVASVGKLATAVLVMQLVEERIVSLSTPVISALPEGTTDGLCVIDGVDHAPSVTVGQLLAHESGIADYFESEVISGSSFIELITTQTERLWQPQDLLEFSRRHQRAVSAPGAGFHYSDTGYILLGLMVEHLTGVAFHDLLHRRIFTPLGMDDSYLMFRSAPARPGGALSPLWIGGIEASRFTSMSCDWAGGGIVSTVDDLLKFGAALRDESLVSNGSLAKLSAVRHRFRRGIHYGTGMMEVRFEEFFFLLRRLPRPTGHIGVLGTHLFYDAKHDAHIVMNFGSTTEMVRSFRTLIRIEGLLQRGR